MADSDGDDVNALASKDKKDAKKKKHKKKSTKKDKERDNGRDDGDVADLDTNPLETARDEKKSKKEKKKSKDKKRRLKASSDDESKKSKKKKRRRVESDGGCQQTQDDEPHFPFEYQHILAPMVGASELAFRLLCRKYGATLSYTPMMSAGQFVKDAAEMITPTSDVTNSNICEFQTIPQDRPLVCHFSANKPDDFAAAARLVESCCDAVDLNLGCPQRTAYLGHFGSYLLGDDDRELVLDIVRAGSRAVSIPIFVKIRLLDSIEETIKLCHQLRDAGASLIAIHARCEFVAACSLMDDHFFDVLLGLTIPLHCRQSKLGKDRAGSEGWPGSARSGGAGQTKHAGFPHHFERQCHHMGRCRFEQEGDGCRWHHERGGHT